MTRGRIQDAMAATRTRQPEPPDSPLTLLEPRESAAGKLRTQIDRGKQLASRNISSQKDLDTARADADRWEKYTSELLKRLFSNDSIQKEFDAFSGSFGYVDADLHFYIGRFREDMRHKENRLESIVERLELIPERAVVFPTGSTAAAHKPNSHSRKIFVVHGHDEAIKQSVCRFLERLSLEPIVLHEQASKGGTVIEKIEANSDVAFAVVLMTGDDVGAVKTKRDSLQPRARQNVLLELGYFIGKIGRARVCPLYEAGVELPSDFGGVVYVPVTGGWELALAKEMRAAGIEVDLNRL